MMKIKNLVFGLLCTLIVAGLYSCSNEETYNLEQEKVLDTSAKKNYSVSLRNPIDNKYYDLNILSITPLSVNSDYFEVKRMNVEDENGLVLIENAEIVVFKDKSQTFSTGNGWTKRPGYWLNDSDPYRDCWVYGVWFENTETGQSIFVEASLEDRFMNNICTEWGTKYA